MKIKIKDINGKVLNLAYGGTTTVNDIFYGIRDALAKHISSLSSLEPQYSNKRKGDILHSHANISMVVSHLGYSPLTDLREGLEQTISWYFNQNQS